VPSLVEGGGSRHQHGLPSAGGPQKKRKNQHVCALLHGLRWIALAVGGVCPDLDAQNPRAWDRVEVAEQEGEQKDDRTRTASCISWPC
jgi:hypothetical protein